MAEGYNPTLGCGTGCRHCTTWVPFPKAANIRRDPLLDAVGITDNPCERPSRNNPCCNPMPKFRRPRELPLCDINCYREEQRRAKQEAACEEQRLFRENCCPPPASVGGGMIVEALSPDHPIHVEFPDEPPPEEQYILQEIACRTNIIAGYFNPDDNKTVEQKLKEQCDQTYLSCGPNLPLYPCRGVIQYPPQVWTTVAKEMDKCGKLVCERTKYCDPAFQEQQIQEIMQRREKKRMQEEQKEVDEKFRSSFWNPKYVDPCCANQKLSLTPWCNCGVDTSF